MKTLRQPALLTLILSLACAFFASGCNTMKGLGKDTERAGEKIQQNASK
jgi:predicted small secreted protein